MKILNREGKEIQKLDLGIVEAGTSKEYEFQLYNDSSAETIDLKVVIPNKEVTIITFPERLDAQEREIFKIRWSPSVTLKQGLQTVVRITGAELYK